jgi:ADP-ribosylation factor-like protein 8
MGNFFSWVQDLFWSQEMEIAILGLSAAGKSSFVHVVDTGHFEDELPPTLGFNIHSVKRNAVTIKVWDMAGQKKFQGMWERYCREVNVRIYVMLLLLLLLLLFIL